MNDVPGTILVTFALAEEAAPFRARAMDQRAIEILVSGIGRANAERAIRSALARHKPSLVLTCGYAGALDPSLHIGEVVFDAKPDVQLSEKLAASGAKPVKFFCSSTVLITANQKSQARGASGAQAVEMESEPIRRACREQGISSATVRAISDLAGEDFPLDFNQLTRADQSLDPKKLAWAILRSPGCLPGLLKLRKHTQAAGKALAEVLIKFIECPAPKVPPFA